MSSTVTRYVLGVTGGSGSGKSTFVKLLAQKLGLETTAIIPQDSYYRDLTPLPVETRQTVDFDQPDAIEMDLLIGHLRQLKTNAPVKMPVYDFSQHIRAGVVVLNPKPVILVEGILLFNDPELYQLFDYRIFLDTPSDLRLIRRLERDTSQRGRSVESVIDQWEKTVRPAFQKYVEPTKKLADIVIPGQKPFDDSIIRIVQMLNNQGRL